MPNADIGQNNKYFLNVKFTEMCAATKTQAKAMCAQMQSVTKQQLHQNKHLNDTHCVSCRMLHAEQTKNAGKQQK